MKTRVFTMFTALILMPVSLFATNVTFKIEGLRSNRGFVWVGIYDNEKTYLKEDGQITDCEQQGKIADGKVDVVCSLKPGVYGAAAYHDENGNKKFDTNFIGMPKEGYGFPNNIKARFSPPDYHEVLFTVGENDFALEVVFQY
ncbi:MAG: DUF2141 domain-containing protein [Proteobacteria bacterium]|nr:DUF2141 domain-containing protein [Pseudomonadota bacterium]